MTCQDAQAYLDDLVDDELSPEVAARVRDHLQTCSDCRAQVLQTERLTRLLGQAGAPDPGANYWSEVTSLVMARTVDRTPTIPRQINLREESHQRRAALWRSVVSAVASLTILFSALVLGLQEEASRLAQERMIGNPVLATADVRDLLAPEGTPVYSASDQLRLAQGMLLMGVPGMLGRFAGLPDLVGANVQDN